MENKIDVKALKDHYGIDCLYFDCNVIKDRYEDDPDRWDKVARDSISLDFKEYSVDEFLMDSMVKVGPYVHYMPDKVMRTDHYFFYIKSFDEFKAHVDGLINAAYDSGYTEGWNNAKDDC